MQTRVTPPAMPRHARFIAPASIGFALSRMWRRVPSLMYMSCHGLAMICGYGALGARPDGFGASHITFRICMYEVGMAL